MTDTITVKVSKKDLEKIKTILDNFKERYPHMDISALRYGKIGDDVVLNFKIEDKFAKMVVEKLHINNIKLLVQTDNTKKIIANFEREQNKSAPIKSNGWSDIISSKKIHSKPDIEDLVKDGKYNDLIKVSRTIMYGKTVSDEAKQNIDHAIENAINQSYAEGLSKKFEVEKNIDKLIYIASENNLKMMNKLAYMKDAGLKAIELCVKNKDSAYHLISIANNSVVHNLISIKAAIELGKIILNNPEEFEEDIEIAVQKLNLRWLNLVFMNVENDIEFEERKIFNDLIKFIQDKRSEK